MSTAARKARKRAGIRHERKVKKPTRPWMDGHTGLGLITGPEIIARLLARPSR
jgi:hypothetical protein